MGSGILVSRRQDYLYVLTAEHVVRQGWEDAEEVNLRFHFWREDLVPAEVLSFSEGDLDLAVLRVDMAAAPFLRPHVEELAEVAADHGVNVCIEMHPNMLVMTGNVVDFEYNCEGGASGGAIFDQRARLRGLIQQYDGKLCYALVFPVIRQVVEDGQGKGCGLTRAGLRAANQVMSG